MPRTLSYVPEVAIFLAGVGALAMTMPRHRRGGIDAAALDELKGSVASLEARIQARESSNTARMEQIETTLEAHSAALADVPSTAQIVAAMEQLLSRTLASLDERLGGQSRSIEVLKTTVSQTDCLLERVLESLDTLQSYADAAQFTEDPLLSRSSI
jgi:chromosome segregation ATPase